MTLAALTRDSVLAAMAEFDQLGRTAFLERYQFGQARQFFLEFNGHRYDSKAITSAAYKYATAGSQALAPSAFSGGERTVKRRLEALGFVVVRVLKDPAQAQTSPSRGAPALPLPLHGRYGRRAVFEAVGQSYTPQNQRQNTGLSLRCKDGGYLVFITMDKSELISAYDSNDELFADRLHWVTRRAEPVNRNETVGSRD